MVLDAASLEAIIQEIRTCFLYEDAPDHLAVLKQGIRQLRSNSVHSQAEYDALMRAAHSLKGSSGLAQLSTLSRLAHKLEDLLEALHQGRVQQREAAYELLSASVEQISNLIAHATSENAATVIVETSLLSAIAALEDFLEGLPKTKQSDLKEVESNLLATPEPDFLKIALEVDLENSLQKVERLLHDENTSFDPVELNQALTALVGECTLLGQALNLSWLTETGQEVRDALAQPNPHLEAIAETAISELRQLRLQVLTQAPQFWDTSAHVKLVQQQSPITPPPEARQAASQIIPVSQNPQLNLRIPVSKLDRMNNTIGELFISYERLSLYQEQLHQVDLTLKKRAAQLNPIGEQVQNFYDQLATEGTRYNKESNLSPSLEFDSLEFDQYANLHNTLQDLQELMVQVQEARADVGLITSEFREALVQLRQQLNGLHGDLTQSRLVPFGFLTEQFVALLQTLDEQYHKSAQLIVIGKETLIDQVILEQLKVPLTHLIRNAFDHGIETSEERLALDKSINAQIVLSAAVEGNQITIAIEDDGRGIDIQTVYQRAIELGLCSDSVLTKQVLEFLFMPGFSTAATVTTLSGRGVGLDIVKRQVERLRGSVEVESKLGQGTKFIINIPLTLNILPLLLCSCQQQTFAIPSNKVIEIISLKTNNASTITWGDRLLPLYPLIQLLPYTQQAILASSDQFNHQLGIVVNVNGEFVAIAVDSLLGERELVLKAFDPIVKVPPYISGCTVLGTGEVVPVLSPDHLGELIAAKDNQPLSSSPTFNPYIDSTATILIVDDSITFRKALEHILTQSGYQVVQCRNGKEALEKLNQPSKQFDLVISDIEMPRLDGFGLLGEIRARPQWDNLAVVMLTSRENDRYRQKAMNLGATAYFTKPFRPGELLNAIAALLT
ncbi:MAG: hybrid sensor histidine kinase/response regulator [Gloeocapsa sp. UFS-A4-WI-NPMV-4B04]|jgi:type IV pili sensor histidine kinase/response regulator|nr:hybrid sensor histidine kinase/response regulator [Gloeocapsa sp. UFS-A4-WI-NPMV-4B04]